MADPSRWDQICELLELASAAAPGSDLDAVLRAHTQDEALRREVLSLLAVGPSLEIFERPALDLFSGALDSPVQSPDDAPPRLFAGEMLCARFRVGAFLGRGGMAEVYEADDLELAERVALKFLNSSLAAQPDFSDRFRREIRLSRRISHHNVARVFDFLVDPTHSSGALHFYVMELLTGETLAERLARSGPLPLDEATNVANQLAAGLDAAHSAGVIHRDFKPSNIMLTPGRAVITDFGLAAPIAPGTTGGQLRNVSMLLGTPGYVAPEQWTGKPPSIATDIYSFGIVLHELITAKHPNALPGNTPLPHPGWQKTIDKCLAVDPVVRWKSARAAVAELQPVHSTRRKWLGVSGAAAAALCIGLGVKSCNRRLALPPGTRVALAALENHTTDPALDAWPNALARQLDLSRTIQPAKESQAGADAAKIREAAMRGGIPLVVFSSVASVGGELSLNVRMELLGTDPAYPARVWRKDWAASNRQDLLRLAAAAGSWIRDAAGESQPEIQARSQAPEVLTSASWDALQLFSQGDRTRRTGNLKLALSFYSEATQIDPKFALAVARSADLQAQLNDLDASLESQTRAAALLRSKAIATREALGIRVMQAVDCWEFAEGQRVAALLQGQFPDDHLGNFYAADFHRFLGRYEQAIPLYREAFARAPKAIYINDKLVMVLLALGRIPDAAEVIRQEKLVHDGPWIRRMDAIAACARNDFQAARGLFISMTDPALRPDDSARIFSSLQLAYLESEQGRIHPAIEAFEKTLDLCRRLNRNGEAAATCLHLAELHLWAGDKTRAAEYAVASASAGGYLAHAAAAEYLIRAGNAAHPFVRTTKPNQVDYPRVEAADCRLRAEAALAAGDHNLALQLFTRAHAISPSHLFPDGLVRALRAAGRWDDLRTLTAQLRQQSSLYFGRALDYPPGGLARLG